MIRYFCLLSYCWQSPAISTKLACAASFLVAIAPNSSNTGPRRYYAVRSAMPIIRSLAVPRCNVRPINLCLLRTVRSQSCGGLNLASCLAARCRALGARATAMACEQHKLYGWHCAYSRSAAVFQPDSSKASSL
jgi:hypothetical protein